MLGLDDRRDPRRRVGVGEVGGDDRRATELGGQRAQPLLAPRDEDELAAGLAGEAAGRGLADPAGGSGDERDHAGEATPGRR